MKYFSTGFFLHGNVSSQDIINECLDWIYSSPHTSIPRHLIYNERGNKNISIDHQNEMIETINCNAPTCDMICFRYSKISIPHKWITDISINEYTTGPTWVQIESSVITQDVAYKVPKVKKPLIVFNLINKFSGGLDDIFDVDIDPLYLRDSAQDLDLSSKIILSQTKNRLPIIYVSSKFHFKEHAHNLIPERLSRNLSGLAHVIIEPSSHQFSKNLSNKTDSKNVYGGTVGIYWPNGQGVSIHKRGDLSAKNFENNIVNEVLDAISSLVPLQKCGWNEIINVRNRLAMQSLKEKGNDNAELVNLYEIENESLREETKELNNKIVFLENRVRRLQEKSLQQSHLAINIGDEDDLFDGEILEILMRTLSRTLSSSIKEKTRSYDIIRSIIDNNKTKDEIKEKENRLKKALNGYTSLSKPIQSQLESIGFNINEDGKHIKIAYYDDPRYTYVLPKTGSDRRGSLNAISDISNIVF